MKNKRTIFFVLILILCLQEETKGQINVLMGFEVVLPQEELNDIVLIGLGGTGGIEVSLTEKLGLTGQIGYIYLRPNSESVSAYMLPLQVGFKYYFNTKEKGIYLHPKFGTHKLVITTKASSGSGYYYPQELISLGGTSYGFGVGYLANKEVDIEIRYNVIANDNAGSYVGIRLGFSIL